ncbi:RHD3/Sey1 domain-containing protein, partial [Rozella allomycis CSF55]
MTNQIQLIDDEQKFNQNLESYVREKWQISDIGFDYTVVAVFGAQTGTLLNRLFGTAFQEMDDTRRQQTTKGTSEFLVGIGIWMSPADEDRSVLIMDVEGTDGRERGENQDFERKSALFSLSVSQILIVNLWEHSVGLYNGASMGLLKTVFEVHLQLFQQPGMAKKLLLFVIRDFEGSTPLINLENTLRSDLDRIWRGLSKPEMFREAEITDLFDLKFVGLAHKRLQANKFNEDVLNLKQWFFNKQDAKYLMNKEYKNDIPSDGFSKYADAIWEKIVSNKDLDLPTQQELLAQYRCDEIMNNSLSIFTRVCHAKRNILEEEIIEDFKEEFEIDKNKCIEEFKSSAHRYKEEIYRKKLLELEEKINENISSLFLIQQKHLIKKYLNLFNLKFTTNLKSEGFLSSSNLAKNESLNEYKKSLEKSVLNFMNFDFEKELKEFENEIEKIIESKKSIEISKI